MIRNLIFYIGYFYFLMVLKTSRAVLLGREELEQDFDDGKQVVFCAPHNFLLGLFAGIEIAQLRRPRVTLVVSMSQDGELIAKLLKKFRFDLARGSSNRGGKKALFEMLQAGKRGESLGLAYDGPKGPPLVPKRGLIGCARATGENIYVVTGRALPNKFLKFLKPFRVGSWDKFLIPVPFCRIEVGFQKVPLQNVPEEEKEDFILNFIEKHGKSYFADLYNFPQKK